ncbi:MAG: NAD(+)/NADH kinase, partial [Nitrososphaera sp.]
MVPSIRNVIIVTKAGSREAEAAAIKVAGLLSKSKVNTYVLQPLKTDSVITTSVAAEDLKDLKIDLVFAIGGDGTTLRAFRMVPGKVPLFSINSGGHRGILSEADASMIEEAIDAILSGKYFYDSRIRI